MLLRDLTKVYISEDIEIENHGESEKIWRYKGKCLTVKEVNEMPVNEFSNLQVRTLSINNNRGIAYLNLQQDVNELDRKSTGEIDYSIYKARTTQKYDINKGDGISLTDISTAEKFKPEYIVKNIIKVGGSIMYRLEKLQ